MKLPIFVLIFANLQVAAKIVTGQKISLNLNKAPLETALHKIEAQSGFSFFYDRPVLRDGAPVTIRVKNETVEQTLKTCFGKQPLLTYAIVGKVIIIKRKQQVLDDRGDEHPAKTAGRPVHQLTVEVTDSTGQPLAGASVQIETTSIGGKTDGGGSVVLNGVEDPAKIRISYVGYKTAVVEATSETTLHVTLLLEANALNEIVIVGYGTQRKGDVTGAVASFSARDLQLNTMPQTTITQSLQGRIAGMNITTNSGGAEGNDNTIQVRGRNSISAGNSPLIILDGVPFSDNISEINPNDIASVDVLKDASAAAIYGSRAANGVILITTKHGATGKAKIGYNGYYGIDNLAYLPDMMNADQFYQTKVDRFGESALTKTEIDAHSAGINTDWAGLATRQGSRQHHNLSVNGGSDQIHYYISGNYDDIQGVAKNDDYTRVNIRINLEAKIRPWLTLGTNTQLGKYGRDGLAASFSNAFTMNPLTQPYNEDGKTLNLTPWPEDAYWDNPLDNLNVLDEDATHSIFSNNYLQVDVPFIKGLSYRINSGYDYRNRSIEDYYRADTRSGLQQKGKSVVNNWNYEDWLVENIVTYNRRFGKHSIALTGLYSAQSRVSKEHNLTASGFPGDFMTNYQNALATVWTPTDSYQKQNYISQMGRLNYNYNEKYLLTATIRRDGYSAFGTNSKYGAFPSIALGWNLSEESFLKSVKWVEMLKVRVSYGKNGNQAINPYATLPQLAEQPYLDNNGETAIGFYPSRLGDPNLGWETTDKLNLGVDYNLFNNRLHGSLDYYYTRTHDLLLNKLISPVNGTKIILQNIGEVKNSGLEFTVGSINVQSKDFRWTTDFNISLNRNKIVNVGLTDSSGHYTDDISNKWFIGKPIGVNYSYVFDGIWQEGDDIAGSAQPTAKPGDVKVKDLNGDGLIDAGDKSIVGSQQPSYIAGMTNTFSYKGFSLSILVRSVQGTTKYNDMFNTYFDGRNAAMNRTWWTPENKINTYPQNRDDSNPFGLNYFGRGNNSSFVKISDVTLGYTFPDTMLQRWKLSNLNFYFNAKNLTTFTKWKGMDPELSSQIGSPLTRTYVLGLQFGF